MHFGDNLTIMIVMAEEIKFISVHGKVNHIYKIGVGILLMLYFTDVAFYGCCTL